MTKNMEDIQLVLMSNASWREFPENTNSDFKVRLAKPLRIEPKSYKVGLVDAHYAKTWTTYGGQQLLVTKLHKSSRFDKAIVTLPKKRYENFAQVVDELNSELAGTKLRGVQLSENVLFEFDEDAHEIRMKLFNADEDENTNLAVFLESKNGLSKMLGITGTRTEKGYDADDVVVKGSPPEFVKDLWTSLYVYCDLAEEYCVGDGLSNLIRILPQRTGADAEVYEEPGNIQWLEAAAKDSDIVRVNIRRDDGRPIAFDGGKVILSVRLKPV